MDPSNEHDGLEPDLEQRFAELAESTAPDIWARLGPMPAASDALRVPNAPVPATEPGVEIVLLQRVHSNSNTLLRVAAALVLLVGLGVWGRSLVGSSDEAQIEIAEGTQPRSSTPPAEPEGCDARKLQKQLQGGMALIDFDTTESMADLVARSDEVVFGSLVNSYGYGGGSILTLDGDGADQVWVPSRIPAGPLEGFVLAFLSDEVGRPSEDVRAVLPEGLWIACEPDEAALPGLAAPIEPRWQSTLGSATLEDLMEQADELQWQATIELTFSDDRLAIYRIAVDDLELRLSLPAELANNPEGEGDIAIVRAESDWLRISAEQFEVVLSGSHCDETDTSSMTLNHQGSMAAFQSGGAILCRSHDYLGASFTFSLEGPADLDLFDVRFMENRRFKSEYGPGIPEVGPWRVGSIVIRVGNTALAGLDPDTLREMWRFESEGEVLWPTVRQSALLVGEDKRLVRLDPANGETLWTAEFPDDGRAAYLLDSWDGRVLRFASGGTSSPEQLSAVEKIDVASGEVLWRATGRPGGIFSDTVPIQTSGIVLASEYLDPEDLGKSPASALTTYAIDDGTGEILWVSDFEIGDARYTREGGFASFIVTSDGPALIMRTVNQGVVRVDPQTGEIIWSAVVQWGPIIGRQVSSDDVSVGVAIQTPDGVVLLDPETGERLPT